MGGRRLAVEEFAIMVSDDQIKDVAGFNAFVSHIADEQARLILKHRLGPQNKIQN